ncbi:hypothetical protein FPQ18DRAFT_336356 [Pyronema domesticum]|uniref:Uncharacterized protein n=1 Tax=Pyronema omphalodes (strain CBS 100304) TaxID=1076935 RepID=U4KYZ5_PYROM|nr:hypothetical protein FPQ18DRAFT_336356 [Pyronema domesticum]CCX07655.1 Similar to hypothetical protein AOL_s00188g45 [Arthrobotrys oligospora ATCC 24927]; acc. no. EGX44707 [Pyronema omphalodes CBS 100304]
MSSAISSDGPRHRQVYTHADLLSDDNEILYMDETSQEQLIQDLQVEDLKRNEFYCKCLLLLTVLPIPYFFVRYWNTFGGAWIFNMNLFAIISLLVSWRCIPVPRLRPTMRDAPLVQLEKILRQVQLGNVAVTLAGTLWTMVQWAVVKNERVHPAEEYLVVVPMFMAVGGWMMRNALEAVNFGELEHLRYQYKGA